MNIIFKSCRYNVNVKNPFYNFAMLNFKFSMKNRILKQLSGVVVHMHNTEYIIDTLFSQENQHHKLHKITDNTEQ